MVHLDLCFPLNKNMLMNGQFEASNIQILYIKVLKMVMFRMLANKWVHIV